MNETILLVKNMVCQRCILAIETILQQEAIPFHQVIFGEIHLVNPLTPEQKQQLAHKLTAIGFELIDTRVSTVKIVL
jgi:hypothetical protein